MFRVDLTDGKSSTMVTGRTYTVHTTFKKQEVDLVEEYDLQSHELLVRRWREAAALGSKAGWRFEIGEEKVAGDVGGGMMRASSSAPVCVSRDKGDFWQWRIRNLPYEKDVYSVTVDDEKQQLVLRTSNKKYFKRIDVPAMRRCEMPLDQDSIGFDHGQNTLVIQYRKPAEILERDQKIHEARQAEFKSNPPKDGDVDCKQQ